MTDTRRYGLHRRHLLGCACALGVGIAGRPASAHDGNVKSGLTPEEALQKLKDGNAAYRAESQGCAIQSQARRIAIAARQAPSCVVVCCSDSRVSPEILFRCGLGELFIVRNAGNTIDVTALGSIEYAVEHFGVPLILVMGHSRCGAVEAAAGVVLSNAVYPEAIEHMIEPIVPAVLSAHGQPGDLIENAVRANVDRTVVRLRSAVEPILIGPQKAGTLRVVGAAYSLDSGTVDFFNAA